MRTAFYALVLSLVSTASMAQGLLEGGTSADDPLRFTSGALLVHGNYCGPGNNGPDKMPIDALDAACMRHDACTPDDAPPSCDCNARLASEAHAVSISRRQSPELRRMAGAVEAFVPLIPCHD